MDNRQQRAFVGGEGSPPTGLCPYICGCFIEPREVGIYSVSGALFRRRARQPTVYAGACMGVYADACKA